MRLEASEHRFTVTLARPGQRNAQTPAMWRALRRIGDLVAASSARVVVLRGDGPSFSAGLDRRFLGAGSDEEPGLASLARLGDAGLHDALQSFQAAFTWWREVDAVTVAAVAGHAVGAGFQLALACDLRVVADDTSFAMRETSLGLVPDLAGTGPLTAMVGYPRALEICATGRWLDAREAAAAGIAQAVVPRPDLDAAVDDLVAALTAVPAGALPATKHLLRGAATRTPAEQLAAERRAQVGRLRDLAG